MQIRRAARASRHGFVARDGRISDEIEMQSGYALPLKSKNRKEKRKEEKERDRVSSRQPRVPLPSLHLGIRRPQSSAGRVSRRNCLSRDIAYISFIVFASQNARAARRLGRRERGGIRFLCRSRSVVSSKTPLSSRRRDRAAVTSRLRRDGLRSTPIRPLPGLLPPRARVFQHFV